MWQGWGRGAGVLAAAAAIGCGGEARVGTPGEAQPLAAAGAAGASTAEPGARGSAGEDVGDAGAGGGGGQGGSPSAAGGPGGAAAGGLPSGGAPVLDDAEWVFDDAALRTYSLSLDPALWEALQANAQDEEYVLADLEVDGEVLPQVGLRFKGGYGTLTTCFDDAGNQVCPKLSMKLKLDELDPEQRLRGLERLNFNSMVRDPSALHDRLGYRLFRELGIVAPRATHARLVINGEYRGLFSLVEQVDGRFTDSRFEPGDGNLYKECWPTDGAAALADCLKTNEDSAEHSGMLAFGAALNGAAPAELAATVARHASLEQLLTYLAVDHTINNWDGVTGFYCFGEGCHSFNYYLYQHEGEPRFTLIPWDLDQTFAVSTHFAAVPGPLDIPADCSARYEVSPGVAVQAPACDPLIGGLARADRAPYLAALGRLVEGPLAPERVNGWLDAWQAQIEPAVAEDPYGPGLDAFRAAVAGLRDDLRVLRLRASAERDGLPIERLQLAPGVIEGFEAASPLAVGLGVTRSATTGSYVGVEIGASGALSGERDLLSRFEFRDGLRPWGQWAQLRVPLAAAGLDAGGTLRLLVRSEAPRALRIGIDSAAYSDRGASGEIGWDLQLDGTVQQLELELGSASFPAWGSPVPDAIEDLLAGATALLFEPAASGRGEAGLLGEGIVDVGELRIDELELAP